MIIKIQNYTYDTDTQAETILNAINNTDHETTKQIATNLLLGYYQQRIEDLSK